REDVLAAPELRPELELAQPRLLAELAAQGGLGRLAAFGAAAGRRPPDLPDGIAELDEQDAVVAVEHERADRRPRLRLEPRAQRREPPQPLRVRDRRIRGRRRREDEQADVLDRPQLRPELGALAERAA